MPTGGGKSLTFQVPALTMEGVCIVITPLIALMKDQVDNLKQLGIKATAVYSGMSRREIITQLENCIFGDYKFLYISPERLGTEIFKAKLQAMKVSFLVVDESHCISQWGYDFRPSYLKIASIREELPGIPVLALTATATHEVIDDIQERLHFSEKNVFRTSFVRENLAYIVRETDDKIAKLIHILQRIPGSAIVYVRNRQKTKEIAVDLQKAGFSADFFHAGLNRETKNQKQNNWKNNETRVIVATNAFGMGIDKPDVRLVVHFDFPGSLEEYYQEAGRAGRDRKKAYAVALGSTIDISKLKKRISDEFPDKSFIYRVYEALGNFYQIAVGYGFETVHDFNLAEFSKAYHFSMLQTHHALKLLELSGYIEYTEEVENASRLHFKSTKEELYRYLHQDKITDAIIQVILRSYTGLFSDYVYIDEGLISTRANVTRDEVYQRLVSLSKAHIVNYIPRKKTPLIIYTTAREDQKYVTVTRAAYEERKERFEKRIAKVVEYLKEDKLCRSKMLLDYFGEKNPDSCKSCDICLRKHDTGLTTAEYSEIRDKWMELLTPEPQFINDLAAQLGLAQEKAMQVIRYMVDHEPSILLKDGYLSVIN